MGDARSEIEEIVNRETRAWDTLDADLLLSVFHPDMVWPFPKTSRSHDPMEWILELGRYNPERWGRAWQELFDTHELDGALAVVDIDTLWRAPDGSESRWRGRVCKVYSKVGDEWKMTMHTGVLEYP